MNFSFEDTSRLAIGTAQYGMNYGLANKTGKISDSEMFRILNNAKDNNILTIDTAKSYGDCEQKLGTQVIDQFRIMTKISNLTQQKNINAFVLEELKDSLKKLNLKNLDTLLLHRSIDLLDHKKNEVYDSLLLCKEAGLIKKFGISSDNILDVERIINIFDIDIVQFPFNIFNRELIESGLLLALKNKKIEVHARSIFLQGLLLMDRKHLNPYFNKWSSLFEKWEEWNEKNQFTKLESCLKYVFGFKDIDKYIIGIDSLRHLQEIINVFNSQNFKKVPIVLSSKEQALINPSMWKLN